MSNQFQINDWNMRENENFGAFFPRDFLKNLQVEIPSKILRIPVYIVDNPKSPCNDREKMSSMGESSPEDRAEMAP